MHDGLTLLVNGHALLLLWTINELLYMLNTHTHTHTLYMLALSVVHVFSQLFKYFDFPLVNICVSDSLFSFPSCTLFLSSTPLSVFHGNILLH